MWTLLTRCFKLKEAEDGISNGNNDEFITRVKSTVNGGIRVVALLQAPSGCRWTTQLEQLYSSLSLLIHRASISTKIFPRLLAPSQPPDKRWSGITWNSVMITHMAPKNAHEDGTPSSSWKNSANAFDQTLKLVVQAHLVL